MSAQAVLMRVRSTAGGRIWTPVARLIVEVDRLARERGANLSRWESHVGSQTRIVYAVHYGPRPAHSERIPPTMLVAKVTLNAPEGSSERCAAYEELTKLAQDVLVLPIPRGLR